MGKSPDKNISAEETFTPSLTSLQERQELRSGEGFKEGKIHYMTSLDYLVLYILCLLSKPVRIPRMD